MAPAGVQTASCSPVDCHCREDCLGDILSQEALGFAYTFFFAWMLALTTPLLCIYRPDGVAAEEGYEENSELHMRAELFSAFNDVYCPCDWRGVSAIRYVNDADTLPP